MEEEENEISMSSEKEQVVNNNNDSDDNEEYSLEDDTWIEWFCKMEGNHYFVEISIDFLEDNKNLLGLEKEIPDFYEYLEVILSKEAPSSEIMTEDYIEKLGKVKELYGILHKRFIYTQLGLSLIREKYLNGVYGVCPRILCHKQTCLPYGIGETIKYCRVSIFCPSCEDIYKPRGNVQDIDGGYFGPSLPQVFFMNFPDLVYFRKPQKFIPKLYGFKVYGKEGSKYDKILNGNSN